MLTETVNLKYTVVGQRRISCTCPVVVLVLWMGNLYESFHTNIAPRYAPFLHGG